MFRSSPAHVNRSNPPPAGIGGRVRALHVATSARGPASGAKAAKAQASTKADALVVASGTSTTFRLFDQVPDGIAIYIDGNGPRAAEERIRDAVSVVPAKGESDRRMAASASPAGARLDSRGATFLSPVSNPQSASGAAGNEGSEPSHLLASTKGRYDLRHGIASMLRPEDGGRGPSVCGCGISGFNVEAVRVHQNERGKAHASGVFRCDSAVLCPVCSVKRSMEIQQRLTVAVQACIDQGGSVWFLTPTVRRKLDQDLAKLRVGFQAAYREARQGVGWAVPSVAGGFLGITNVIEAPWSPATGWGLHGHSLLFFASPFAEPKEVRLGLVWQRAERAATEYPRTVRFVVRGGRLPRLSDLPDGEAAPEAHFWGLLDEHLIEEHEFTYAAQRPLCDLLMSRFLGKLPKHGLSGAIDAQGVEMVRNGRSAAKYLGKIASEVAHGWIKEGRKAASTSVHPFALAARGSIRGTDGEPMEIPGLENVSRRKAYGLWREYAGAMKGIRLGIITARLAEKLGIEPDKDEEKEGDQEFLEDGHIGDVPARMWNHLVRRCLAGSFLSWIEDEIDPSDGDDFRRGQFQEIRDFYLDSWLETGSDEAKLYARLWRCSGDDESAAEDEDSDASFLSNDGLSPSKWSAGLVERNRLACDAKRLRMRSAQPDRRGILSRLRTARIEVIDRFRRKDGFRRMLLQTAVARLHAEDAYGTFHRVRRVVADLAAEVPGIRPLEEIKVMRACERERRRSEARWAALPQATGVFADDIGDTF